MMQVPTKTPNIPPRGRRLTNSLRLAAFVLLVCTPLFARNPQPLMRIPLEPLGFEPLITQHLLAGSSLFTLHYVDDTHLLLTFSARRLLKRIPGDPPRDQDRTMDALLLEVPSGHVLARTEWRLHDHGQYLWSLGHGQFLLRIRDVLTTFAPLDNLERGDAFAQRPFLHTSRQIVAMRLSPLADLLTLESIEPPPLIDDPANPAANSESPSSGVQINFYRLLPPAPDRDYVVPRAAGVALAKRLVDLPLDSAGYLSVLDQGRQRWAFDFNSYTGKVLPLGLYDSTCRPYPLFVSVSEFITFGCHGGDVPQQLAAFNLRGDEMWEMTLSGSYLSPFLVYAPAGGRFALGRLIVSSAAIESDSLTPAEVSAQSVDVYQIDSGRLLLHVECSPAARAGQNFTFSPDGLNFAIIHDGAIEIYRLPPLTAKDQAAIKLASTSAPQPSEEPVQLTAAAPNSSADTAAPAPTQSTSNPPDQSAPAAPSQKPQPTTAPSGDPTPEQPRKPPTLYEPGESKSQ